jgi:leucyl/phenylalanyl-tRNA--protein transferase
MRAAYLRLHTLGYAHSIETWFQDELVGGLYGLQIGPVFFGESMFSRRTDASKIALSALVRAAPARQIALIDCQLPSAHLKSLGSRSLPRSDFLHLLRQLIDPLDGDSSQAERF